MEHKEETKIHSASSVQICQNCKIEFEITNDDMGFYERIKVPPPTFCPECRLLGRLLNISDRTLYQDKCDMCGKEMISLYHPERIEKVYCNFCWWSDKWDGVDYGMEYDFSKPFFEQLKELKEKVPCQRCNIKNSENCDFCNGIDRCKNCTLVISGIQSINCMYCATCLFSKDSLDCNFILNADHAYESVNSNKIYNVRFNYFSDECIDCSFIFYCKGCTDCFGCVNLRNKKYCIFNKQYSKEEYKKEIKKWDLGSYKIFKKAKEEFEKLYYKTPRRFAMITNSENVTGDDIIKSRNCKNCFSVTYGVENCKYAFQGGLLSKDSYDITLSGDTSELMYQTSGSTRSQNVLFSRACTESTNLEYCENVYSCSNMFGCARLRHKKYCILNKQYSKEEYEKLIPKIKQHMVDMPYVDEKGRVYKYGDYNPIGHDMWAYNESWGHQWFPLPKEKVLEMGYKWREIPEKNYNISIKSSDLPDDIKDVEDSILNEIIECEHKGECDEQCTTAFKILPDELTFYRQMNLALPRLCPNCRHYQRLKKANLPKLYKRKCMCGGKSSQDGQYQNTIEHSHRGDSCQNEFETAIGPDRKEIVYCEKCYQSEFI